MASGIEWTDETWNPVVGCAKVSTGCRSCYAEQVHKTRLSGKHGYPEWMPWTKRNEAHNVTLMPHKLDQPLRWAKPRMVFVNSMSDLFHEQIPDEYIAKIFAVMAVADRHVFQCLTKRPERMRDTLRDGGFWCLVADEIEALGVDPDEASVLQATHGTAVWLPHVWLGVSIENRKWIGRADVLRETPAAVRFISAEPLLGPLTDCRCGHAASGHGSRSGLCGAEGCQCEGVHGALDLYGIGWVIAGGESGKGHRPLDLQWMRDLRDACASSGASYFVKQLGGMRPGTKLEDLPEDLRIREMPV